MSKINIEELTERRVEVIYPTLTILYPNDTIPLMATSLKKGDMQLIIEFKGKKRVVGYIDRSAVNIYNLLRTTGSLMLNISEFDSVLIDTIDKYLMYVAEN